MAKTAYRPDADQQRRENIPGRGVFSRNVQVVPQFLSCKIEENAMLGWALTFLVLALVAGFLGFFGLAGLAGGIAKLLLFAFVVLFLISALSGTLRGRAPMI